MRSTRGDGNCLYRSIGFLYFEYLLYYQIDKLKEIVNQIRENQIDICKYLNIANLEQNLIQYSQRARNYFVVMMSGLIIDRQNDPPAIGLSDQLRNYQSLFPQIDMAIVLFVKHCSYEYLIQNQGLFRSFLDKEGYNQTYAGLRNWGTEAGQIEQKIIVEAL